MYKHTKINHCISCAFFYDHVYDETFMNHECLWYDEEDVPEEQLNNCPECGEQLDYDEDHDEDYCPGCGLIVRGPYQYTAGVQLDYPYGLRI